MTTEAIDIETALRDSKYVRIVRNFDSEGVHGIVLEASESLVLVRQFGDDYRPNGLAILPRRDISLLEHKPKMNEMVLGEGYRDEFESRPVICISSVKSVIRDLLVLDVNLKVLCENCAEADEAGFHVGRIVKVDESSFEFVFFSSEGEWFANPYSIPFESVTFIEIYSDYLKTFTKYIEDCPVPRIQPNKPLQPSGGSTES